MTPIPSPRGHDTVATSRLKNAGVIFQRRDLGHVETRILWLPAGVPGDGGKLWSNALPSGILGTRGRTRNRLESFLNQWKSLAAKATPNGYRL